MAQGLEIISRNNLWAPGLRLQRAGSGTSRAGGEAPRRITATKRPAVDRRDV
jgi:hypothetical protein